MSKIEIKKSKLHGSGLIALQNIKKGETIFMVEGKEIKFLIDSKDNAKKAGLNWLGVGKNKWIVPVGYCDYLNHSCDANAFVEGKRKIKAQKNIKVGEEVTFDYSLNEADIFWNFNCRCKSSICRKKIRSIQFLDYGFFKKKIKFIPNYYKNIYLKYNFKKFPNKRIFKDAWVDFITKDFVV